MNKHLNNAHAWEMVDRIEPPKRAAAERIHDMHEIYALYDEDTVAEQASRCVTCPYPSCVEGCPLQNRIPEWMALTAEGRFMEAAAVSQSTSNMPEICSRVCPQERLCEGSCILTGKEEPVAIGAIEKFINEYAFQNGGIAESHAPQNGKKVAVIGSGPAGIAAAGQLVALGYGVTVFESQNLAGGLLVNGIPAFKLEKTVVARRIELLKGYGVQFRLGRTVGKDLSLADLLSDFSAVFLGVGAQQAKPLGVPGEDLSGVIAALPFLIQKNVDFPVLDIPTVEVKGKRVAVLGGGDTAMDCLRTALRCGATSATCLYRRDLANMPGSRKEFANALEEGAKFQFLTNPMAIVPDEAGAVASVRCFRMHLGEPDSSGRRKPVPVPESEFDVQADIVIGAYGFDPVPFPAGSDLAQIQCNPWGCMVVDAFQMTSVPGVFSGGDSVRGPSLVVHAVRDARKAVEGIHKYLFGC